MAKDLDDSEKKSPSPNKKSKSSPLKATRPSSKEISALLEQYPLHDLEVINGMTPKKHKNVEALADENVFSVETPSLEPSPAKFPHMTPPSQDGRSPRFGTPLSR